MDIPLSSMMQILTYLDLFVALKRSGRVDYFLKLFLIFIILNLYNLGPHGFCLEGCTFPCCLKNLIRFIISALFRSIIIVGTWDRPKLPHIPGQSKTVSDCRQRGSKKTSCLIQLSVLEERVNYFKI